jgi:septum formation protein
MTAGALPTFVPIILASGSETRRRILAGAGLQFDVEAPSVDEDEIKCAMRAERAAVETAATTLARLKAERVAMRRRGALVIGCDQMLDCEGTWLDKPCSRDAARSQLKFLSGRRHRLVSAAVVIRDDVQVWSGVDEAKLTMRPLSEAFIETYLDVAGDGASRSVGGYQFEGIGAQLFAIVDGDFFTILGMPLLPLLRFLRDAGAIAR